MIRPVTPADTDSLVELTAGTGFFKPVELETLREVLGDYHQEDREQGHVAIAWEEAGRVLGYAYYAPAPMTDRTWYLYWIAVDRDAQGRGLGGNLLRFVESDIRARAGRLLLIETSTTTHYEPTRQFYLKFGYGVAAQIEDYYSEGDGMALFGKKLR